MLSSDITTLWLDVQIGGQLQPLHIEQNQIHSNETYLNETHLTQMQQEKTENIN